MSRFSITLAIAFLALAPAAATSAERPRYGGTLRIELRAASTSLDPRVWTAGSLEEAANEKLAALVFDRLLALDNYGRFQPQLATEWSRDAASKRWQFTIRPGVKFSDGTPLTAAEVAAALTPLLPEGLQVSASAGNVTLQSAAPIPDLLELLASSRYFIYHVQPAGALLGTGPFFAEASSTDAAPAAAGRITHLRFRANEDAWSGRPFLDAIEVTLGLPPLRQLFDLQLGKTDLVELSPELVRRAVQENQRVWSSAPVLLYGLRFDETQPASADAHLREAMSLALDRQTMANVLLQKQAEPASALLPQWLSGYAFLFTMETNLARAKEIRATLPASIAAGADPLRLRVDAAGDLAKLLGERVAINTRQSSILVQVVNRPLLRASANNSSNSSDPAAVHLFAWHYSSLSPRVELETMRSSLQFADSKDRAALSAEPEQLYAREKKLLEERQVLPLVVLPEYIGLSQKVRDWLPARWGEWHLADVWLDRTEPAAAPGVSPASASPGDLP
jgi:MarR-like DNA-binding transcriptional regulator SgrR of sgrS sRNA